MTKQELEKMFDEEVGFNDTSLRDKRIIDFIIKSRTQTIKEAVNLVEEIKKRFRCAACDGAKCEHTLGCQSLQDLKSKLKDL